MKHLRTSNTPGSLTHRGGSKKQKTNAQTTEFFMLAYSGRSWLRHCCGSSATGVRFESLGRSNTGMAMFDRHTVAVKSPASSCPPPNVQFCLSLVKATLKGRSGLHAAGGVVAGQEVV